MRNLAGGDIEKNDKALAYELTRSKITVVYNPEPSIGEVKTHITGEYKGIKFWRAWTYWVCEGAVPIEIAKQIYQDPVGKDDVRAGGHCGCVAPETQAHFYTPEGKRVISLREEEQFKQMSVRIPSLLEYKDKYVANDNPETVGKAVVELYHIDTEIGLRFFRNSL